MSNVNQPAAQLIVDLTRFMYCVAFSGWANPGNKPMYDRAHELAERAWPYFEMIQEDRPQPQTHTHVAKYDGETLLRECNVCGLEYQRVNRSRLRDEQRAVLQKASGHTVILIGNRSEGGEKCILDKEYFDELLRQFKVAVDALQITMDVKLFKRLIKTAKTLEEDTRLGKLYSVDDVF